MHHIVIDTCVFVRLPGEYSNTLHCIQHNRDVIAISNEALSEYEVHFKPSKSLLLTFLQQLKSDRMIKLVNQSLIEARLERLLSSDQPQYPDHHSDRRWINLAVAINARFLISINHHFLDLPSHPWTNHILEIVEPSGYFENYSNTGNTE
jgi:predicted nucleic acid-binding protein